LPKEHIFSDLFAIPVAYTDEELLSALHGTVEGGVKNPYTNRPIIMEASPGNFTVQRENGEIIEVFLYHRSGVEYPLRL
jgi:hypothetical protein